MFLCELHSHPYHLLNLSRKTTDQQFYEAPTEREEGSLQIGRNGPVRAALFGLRSATKKQMDNIGTYYKVEAVTKDLRETISSVLKIDVHL